MTDPLGPRPQAAPRALALEAASGAAVAVSAARAAASRRNGAKSNGPKTAAGKAKSARNALKHGVFTKEALERRGHLNKLIRQANRLLNELS